MARDYDDSVGPGWRGIVAPLIAYSIANGFEIQQIKEKFAGLRFYYSGKDEVLDNLILAAEKQAERTCEWCGAPGERTKGGWVKTLCPEHAERYANGERWWLTLTGHHLDCCEVMRHYSHVCSRGTKSCAKQH
jgi:hypothetical protein